MNGVSFESQAKLYSEDPGSGAKGGDLGLVERGQMVPDFESALFKLKDGELSDIIETQFGYHLIKMVAKQGEKAKAKHILIVPKSGKNDRKPGFSMRNRNTRWSLESSSMVTMSAAYPADSDGRLSNLTIASMVKAPSLPMTGNGGSTLSSGPISNSGLASRIAP